MTSTSDIDEMMNRFRLASRELFNHYFRLQVPYDGDGWALEARFSEVQALLFQKLVLEPAALSGTRYGDVQSRILVQLGDTDVAPAMLNRETDSGYWDYPKKELTKEPTLVFVSFFDWDSLGFRDNRYVRVLIDSWPSCQEAVGKHALIESHYVRFALAGNSPEP